MKQIVLVCSVFTVSLGLTGCGSFTAAPDKLANTPALTLRGSIHGGQQPVSNSTVQLYAVGTTGDASAPSALLVPAVLSDSGGNFSLTGKYTCPDPSTLVYITARGGNPGLPSGTNAAIGMMAALGACGSLNSSTFINIDEVTTVAAAAALAPFMMAPLSVGSSAADASALSSAFGTASQYADFSVGLAPGQGQAATADYYTPGIPVATINTLANILASCINSSGPASTTCSQLFSLTGNSTDTLSSMITLMKDPAAYNTNSLFALAGPAGPFQPQLGSAPSDFSVAVAPPTGGSSAITVIPSTVSPGSAIWIVAKSYPPCIENSYNYIQLNYGLYASGGTAQCGAIFGYVPANIPYGTIYGTFFAGPNLSTFTNYPFYVNVVPAGSPAMSFKPDTVFWEGDSPTHTSYQYTVTLKNNQNTPLTLGTPTITGRDAAYFNVDSNQCPTVLTGANTCNVILNFAPPDTAFRYATLIMPGTDASLNKVTANVNLAGNGQY